MYRRLCLLGDLERAVMLDVPATVSRYCTTGSEKRRGTPAWSSSRSFKQISKCNSPAPATTCSPDGEIDVNTQGSDFERRLRPSTSLGRSWAFLTSTERWTTGETENFMTFKLWAVSLVVRVPDFNK